MKQIIIFFLGACVSSFANCMGRDWGQPQAHYLRRSHCDNCQKQLSIFHLIPILSQICLKFKCSYCGGKIQSIYLLFEIIGGISLLIIYHCLQPLSITYIILLNLVLLLMFFTDYYNLWIPDVLQICLLILSLISKPSLIQIVFAALVGLIFLTIYFIQFESIGGGDIKLMTCLALLIPYTHFPIFLFVASLMGIIAFAVAFYIVKKPIKQLPFAPFLIISFHIICLISN